MFARRSGGDEPLVSVVLTTRDRPRFFRIALRCFAHQQYRHRELIVVDDGDQYPVPEAAVKAVGGTLIRAAPGTLLGTKLNLGMDAARGTFCQKMDDDDWYGPRYTSTMVSTARRAWSVACGPIVAFHMPFLFFDLAAWSVWRSAQNAIPGATLFFPRQQWRDHPFRAIRTGEDVWFVIDQTRRGALYCMVPHVDNYLAIRHARQSGDRGHTWTHQSDGRALESYVEGLTPYRTPEALLPRWAVRQYRAMHRESIAAPSPERNALAG